MEISGVPFDRIKIIFDYIFSQPSVLKKNNPAIEKISSSILLKTCCDIVFSISGPQDYKFK